MNDASEDFFGILLSTSCDGKIFGEKSNGTLKLQL